MSNQLDKIQKLTSKILQKEDLIKSILEVQTMYIKDVSTKDLFDFVLETLLRHTESKYGFIGYVLKDENNDNYLKTYAITDISWNKEIKEFYKKTVEKMGGLEFRNLDTLFGHTLKYGKTVISNDAKNDERSGGIPEGHPELNTYMGIPLMLHGKFIGMCGVANKEDGYELDDITSLSPLLESISNFIEAKREA